MSSQAPGSSASLPFGVGKPLAHLTLTQSIQAFGHLFKMSLVVLDGLLHRISSRGSISRRYRYVSATVAGGDGICLTKSGSLILAHKHFALLTNPTESFIATLIVTSPKGETDEIPEQLDVDQCHVGF